MLPDIFERHYSRETAWSSVPLVGVSVVSLKVDLVLKDIFELHRQLCCIIEKINKVYGYQNLVVVVVIFLHLIFSFLLMIPLSAVYRLWPDLLHGINAFIIYVVLLYTLVRPCSYTVAEAKRTVSIVSKLMGKSVCEDLFQELDMYCRQLFLRKVEFSSCGVFTLEIPLILSMLSIVTTYFTIALQFQTTDSSGEISPTTANTLINFTLQS